MLYKSADLVAENVVRNADQFVQLVTAVEQNAEYKPPAPKDVADMGIGLTAWCLIRPFVEIAAVGLCVWSGSGWLLLPALFFAYLVAQRSFTNMHNIVHGTYPLPKSLKRPLRELLMAIYGVMFGYAAHLFKQTHFVHHHPSNRCGVNDDPESLCHRSGIAVLLFGPYHTARVFAYGFKHARSTFDRVVGVIEVVVVLTLMGLLGWTLRRYFAGEHLSLIEKTLAFYGATAAVFLWTFPWGAAWLPHQKCYSAMLGAARNSPGKIADSFGNDLATLISFALVGGTRWHLLHHAYQYVPSCRLGELARDPKVRTWMHVQEIEDDRHAEEIKAAQRKRMLRYSAPVTALVRAVRAIGFDLGSLITLLLIPVISVAAVLSGIVPMASDPLVSCLVTVAVPSVPFGIIAFDERDFLQAFALASVPAFLAFIGYGAFSCFGVGTGGSFVAGMLLVSAFGASVRVERRQRVTTQPSLEPGERS